MHLYDQKRVSSQLILLVNEETPLIHCNLNKIKKQMLKYDNELGILCYNRENTAIVYAVVELPKNVIILYVCIILGIYYF